MSSPLTPKHESVFSADLTAHRETQGQQDFGKMFVSVSHADSSGGLVYPMSRSKLGKKEPQAQKSCPELSVEFMDAKKWIPVKILHRNSDSIFFSTFFFIDKKIILKMKRIFEKKSQENFILH